MKKLLFILPLSLSLMAVACSSPEGSATNNHTNAAVAQEQEASQSATIKEDVDVNKFAELVAKGDGQVVDVRTPGEWADGTMKDAVKMNFFDADFQEQLKKLDKTKPVYVYCKVGGRSGQAAAKMQAMGFTTVYNLIGGMDSWKANGKEVVK